MTIPLIGERISDRAVLAGIALTTPQLEQLAKYYELLAHWNRRINLTALSLDELSDTAIDKIILEPIVSKCLIDFESGIWFDLGSGGGSPAIPLKILCPSLELTLVECKSKKSAFLRQAIQCLGLAGATVWTGRIENLIEAFPVEVRTAQLVTVRGVKLDSWLLRISADLLVDGGKFMTFGTKIPPTVEPFPFTYQSFIVLRAGAGAIHLFIRRHS